MATPVFCCGFECGVSTAHWTLTASASFSTTTVRSGARSLRVNPSNAVTGATGSYAFTASSIMVARYYVYFSTLPNVGCYLNSILAGGASAAYGAFYDATVGQIFARASVGGNGATGVAVTTGQWYRIDVKVDRTNNPHLVDVSVDGTACGQASHGITGATNITAMNICNPATGSWTGDVYFDDIFVSVTSADYPLGAGYVNHFISVADGTHNIAGANDFERSATGTDITNATTDAYTLIDDVPLKSGSVTEYINMIAPPSSNDYVEVVIGNAPGISTPTTAPRAVELVIAVAKGTGTGTNNINILLYNNGGLVGSQVGGNITATSPAAMYFTRQYPTARNGAAWNVTGGDGDFNSNRLRGSTSDAAPDPWWASAMIEAEFEEAGGGTTTTTTTTTTTAAPGVTVKRLMLMGVGS